MTDQTPVPIAADAPADSGSEKMQGEGNYDAARKFDSDEQAFIAKNADMIPTLAKEAADALDGPEGEELRKADAETKARGAE